MVALRGGHAGGHPMNYPQVNPHAHVNRTVHNGGMGIGIPPHLHPVSGAMGAPQPPMAQVHGPGPSMSALQARIMTQNGSNAVKPDANSQVPHNSSRSFVLPSHTYQLLPQGQTIRYPRVPTPQQRECYHQVAGAGGYMSSGVPAPNSGMPQGAMRGPDMRVQPAQSPANNQPMAPPQHDIKQPAMTHSYAPPPAAQAPRQSLYPASYRPAPATRSSHRNPAHQQQMYQGGAGNATAPMMYAPIVYPHSVMPQQYGTPQRSCYPPNVAHLIHPNTYHCLTPYQQNQPPQQTYFYQTAAQPLLSTNLSSTAPTGRNHNSLVTQAPPPPQAAAPPSHLHHNLTAARPMTVPQSGQTLRKKRSYAIAITDPKTGEDVCADLFADHNQTLSGESSERQTPQPETNSVAEEFNRMVIETLNQGTSQDSSNKFTSYKLTDLAVAPHHQKAPSNSDNNLIIEFNLCENKAAETKDPPVVSAAVESPVIVPKLCPTVKAVKSVEPVVEKVKKKSKEEAFEDMSRHMSAASFVPAESVGAPAKTSHKSRKNHRREEESPLREEQISANGPTIDEEMQSAEETNETISTESPEELAIPDLLVEVPSDAIGEETVSEPIPIIESVASVDGDEMQFTTKQAILHQSLAVCSKAKLTEPSEIVEDPESEITDPKNEDIIDTMDENIIEVETTEDLVETPSEEVKEDSYKDLTEPKTVENQLSDEKDNDIELEESPIEVPEMLDTYNDPPPLKEEPLENSEVEAKTEIKPPPTAVTTDRSVLKYIYKKNQWSPINPTGKKTYDRDFLLQLQDDPLSKRKPDNIHMLAAVMKSNSPDGLLPLSSLSRMNSEAFMPLFAKGLLTKGPSREREREPKKNLVTIKSTSLKGPSTSNMGLSSGGGSSGGMMMGTQKNVIHVSLKLKGDVKLSESENAWKPNRRLQNSQLTSKDEQTQEIYRKFRGFLNKVTPENFATLLEKIKHLEINTQERLEGVIDLIFEKAIDEPNFSVTYAAMCSKLSKIMVLVDNSTDQYVNFRALIINKCQAQFEATKVQERILKLEKEHSECTDPTKKKELGLMLEEEHRKVRMRSVGNVRFIGELYKLGMLTSTVMLSCLNHLINKLEEEKLECLCKLLTTIGEALESKMKQSLDLIFTAMQDIVDKKSNKISSRVRFMLKDVIELRRRKWAIKNVIDAQPKTMDQIQKEADYQQRQIELMNSAPMGRDYRGGRDEGGRSKRGGERRGGSGGYDNWSHGQRATKYSVDTTKLKVATNSNKNLSTIKLGPPQHAWNHGSGTKSASGSSVAPIGHTVTNNMYSALENVTVDPTSLRAGGLAKPSRAPEPRAATPPPAAPELSDPERRLLHSLLDLNLCNPNDEEFASQLREKFRGHLHAKLVCELYCYTFDKPAKTYRVIANTLLYSVQSFAISRANFITGFTEILEMAPDLLIDYPKVYEYLATFITPFLLNKLVTMYTLFDGARKLISDGQGHLLLRSVLREMCELEGADLARDKWLESGLQLGDWMSAEQAAKLRSDAQLGPVVEDERPGGARCAGAVEVHGTLLFLMNGDKSCDAVRTYIKDYVGASTSEDWFARALMQAVCEHALFGRAGEGRAAPRLHADRMSKYAHLVSEYGARERRDLSCLHAVQQLVQRLEYPKGVILEIFQYLSEHYIIQREGFLAFEKSEQQPEGKGVMMKALVSFYTNIKEVDNEDSGSED